jgi:Fe-S-cluster-containing dehydrogenase component
MCIQRIQAGKLEAKKQSRMVIDGEIQTACSDACPTNAIIFGDYNDDKSKIHEMETVNQRSYKLLEEIGVKPNVIYQTKVRNVEEEYKHEEEAVHGGGEHHEEKHEGGHEEHGH